MEKHEEAISLAKGSIEIVDALEKFLTRAKGDIDICSDRQSIAAMMASGLLTKILFRDSDPAFRVRYLTEVTKENQSSTKELAKMVEVRHLEGVTGNFAISDAREYVGPLVTEEGKLGQLIYSNAKPLFEQHRYLFDSLWERAIPAEIRLGELSGATPTVVTKLMMGESEILGRLNKVMEA